MSNINLLPNNIKDDIAQSKENNRSITYLLKSMFWLICLIIITTMCWIYFTIQFEGISDLVSRKKDSIQQYSSVESEFSKISDRLITISNIDNNLYTWPGVMNDIQNAMPNGATLTALKMNSDSKIRSEISGIANSKSTVASLRNLLETSKKFDFVNIEKSTTTEVPKYEGEVEVFTLSFSLAEGSLNE